MDEAQKNKETLILIALAKAFTEQSTHLTGMLRHKPKQAFNSAVGSVDYFIKTIENNLTPDEVLFIEGITDIYHNMNLEIKKNNL